MKELHKKHNAKVNTLLIANLSEFYRRAAEDFLL
jgi:hypothetical protein